MPGIDNSFAAVLFRRLLPDMRIPEGWSLPQFEEQFRHDVIRTFQECSGWISVADQLPPPGVEVAVRTVSDVDIGYVAVEDFSPGWFWECRLYASEKVTHWCHLPEPPDDVAEQT